MKNLILALYLSTALCLSASGQDYIESFSHNTDFRNVERTLQYTPDTNGYISCHNGKNLYTRALYGSHSLWRLETSDMPIFAAYHKSENRNIHFILETAGKEMRLDSVADCLALYKGGERIYMLSDPLWKGATIKLTTVADADEEAAYWQIDAKGMPNGAKIKAVCCPTIKIKINRSGDMGADPANCFAPAPDATECKVAEVTIGGKDCVKYIKYADRDLTAANQKALAQAYDKAQADRTALTSKIAIDTPDPYLNTVAMSLTAAADGIWDGLTYQHGAIGWRMPLSGWRGAYTGDFLGWHDRARTHFDAYATSQVTEVEPTIPHPTQDPAMNMARALKKWGTQMYSNGYICRNPEKNNTMHHYDMNLCYIDELLWHLQWTGDLEYAEKMWPVIESSLKWEKRNYDPDDDGLYDAYCCIWASDALYYNSGAVTHSSAYNYRANLLAATIAEKIGKDPTPYINEANKILDGLNSVLWMDDKGTWAEFKDFMGNKQMHTHPAVWTIYHAIDSETATPEQAYRATRYIDSNIPHIPVRAHGLENDDNYAVISTTDWLPYAWSINNVAFAEIYHTALAYWQAGRQDEAARLLKSALLDGMFIGNSPGNVGQISYYDAARGECYRDFADPVGMLSRALVQGLFGFSPDALHNRVTFRPGFPSEWDHASITHPDFSASFHREGLADTYNMSLTMPETATIDSIRFILPMRYADAAVNVNGTPVEAVVTDESQPYATLRFTTSARPGENAKVTIKWSGDPVKSVLSPAVRYADIPATLGVELPAASMTRSIDISQAFNAKVTDIFTNKYESPRSPYTTLQLPVHGMGEWCHPTDTAKIDDSFLRMSGGEVEPSPGIKFTTPTSGDNIAFVSLYDNYPDSITVPVHASADGIALFMAGSTNHMQCYNVNAEITVRYTDDTTELLSLVPPYNWCPIEQDYFIDGKAFSIPTPRPLRMSLKDGVCSTDLGKALNIDGVYGRRIQGGAATILYLPTDPSKQIDNLSICAKSNEVVIGLLGATLIN